MWHYLPLFCLLHAKELLPIMPVSLWRTTANKGKEDFKIVSGKVSTWELGTELFQVPLFDQRGEFAEAVTLKAADNTEFKARPTYSYKVIKNRAIDVVFDNKHIGRGSDFMSSLEDNILEPRIYDLIKEESRKHKTDSLMADGGSLVFEKRLEQIVDKEFEKKRSAITHILCPVGVLR
nr:MAG: SPFH domain / band 7 family protein [Bacteriophage sp.]